MNTGVELLKIVINRLVIAMTDTSSILEMECILTKSCTGFPNQLVAKNKRIDEIFQIQQFVVVTYY